MNLYDFCELLQKDYLVVAVDRGQVIFFDGYISSIGDADTIGINEAKRFFISRIELDSSYYDADIVLYGYSY